MKEMAIQYAVAGLPVVACRGKRPTITAHGFKEATRDEAQISKWWNEHPDANIGMPTGKTSGLWVVDVDTYKEGVKDLPELFPDKEIPETRVARSGRGGKHYYFKCNGNRIPTGEGDIAKGIDVRAEGGMIILPGSIFNGNEYVWENENDFAYAPEWLEQIAIEKRNVDGSKTKPKKPEVKNTQETTDFIGNNLLEKAVQRMIEAEDNTRNSTLNALCFELGKAIIKGDVNEEEARKRMYDAAVQVDLHSDDGGEKGVLATIESGISKGKDSLPEYRPLKGVDVVEFINMELPPRKYVLSPIFPEPGIVELYGAPGSMKTWVAISMALAISSGKQAFWTWKATEPRKVLYIEGEVDPDTQKNIQKLIKGFGFQPEPGFFQVITPNTIPIEQPVPNIATRPGQIALSSQVNWADVIFLDNLNTLASYGKENEVESWLPVQAWMGDLKRRGKSIVFIHHANKSGSSSGTRARQRASDTIISLSDGRNTPTGQKTTVSIEKGRTFYGSDKKPFSLELIENEGGICTWSAEPTKKSEPFKPTSKKLQAKAMLDEGMTAKEVAEKFGKVESTIYRWVKDLKADG